LGMFSLVASNGCVEFKSICFSLYMSAAASCIG